MYEVEISNSAMPVVTECGLLAASEPFYHMDRTADFNVLIYVTEGIIYVAEDGEEHEINPGEIFFLKRGVHHWGSREIKKGTRWYFFHFKEGEPIPNRYEEKTVLPKKIYISDDSRPAHMIQRCIDMFYSSESIGKRRLHRSFFDILSALADEAEVKERRQGLADRICEYLGNHVSEPFSAAALEKEFYLSYKHMAAVFKRDKRETMQQYHTRLKINAACYLLKSTLMPIGEIAAETGYRDALYFSRCFRAAKGISPTEFRRSVRMY
ncbi:MAG: helix-turn-helix domain-containing protein [bacterium]|nr:helix-turn-helix domain-containing protein [bacterium]